MSNTETRSVDSTPPVPRRRLGPALGGVLALAAQGAGSPSPTSASGTPGEGAGFAPVSASSSPAPIVAAPAGPAYPSVVARPDDEPGARPACSWRTPVCVHAPRSIAPSTVLATLGELENIARTFSGALGAPAPLDDGRSGGGSAFDLYLVGRDVLSPGGASAARDAFLPGGFDRASAFALLREDAPAGCIRQNLVARTFASSIQWGLDAGEDPAVREANAAYLAELVAPCAEVTSSLLDDFQAHPERALFHAGATDDAGASLLFPWYLDVQLGRGAPGSVPLAFAALATQTTPPENAASWDNEPDLFDVLRSTLQAKTPPAKLDDLLVDFAVTRLFVGARDDGVHFPEAAFAGRFGSVRFDWNLPFATLPRRVMPERPIEPTGATYVYVDLSHAPRGARLVFRVEWEAPVVFRWALVRIRPDGSEASRVLVAPEQKSTAAEKTVEDLDGLAGVIAIGVNVGDLRPSEPFDPDAKPYESHGYVLTVAAQ
jgi:hypothetical protein